LESTFLFFVEIHLNPLGLDGHICSLHTGQLFLKKTVTSLPMNKILMLRHLFSKRSGRDEWMQFGRMEAIKEIADAFEIKLLNLENKQA